MARTWPAASSPPTSSTWPPAPRHGAPSTSSGLRFRASDLTALDVVVEVTLRVHAGDRAAAEAEIAEIVRWRRENQPGGQNAGSVFVNPVPGEVSAGLLIDELGLRGLRVGTACGVGEARQLHPGLRRRLGARCPCAHRAGSGTGRRSDRRRAAQRGPPGRVRGRAMSEPTDGDETGDRRPATRRPPGCSTSCTPPSSRQRHPNQQRRSAPGSDLAVDHRRVARPRGHQTIATSVST